MEKFPLLDKGERNDIARPIEAICNDINVCHTGQLSAYFRANVDSALIEGFHLVFKATAAQNVNTCLKVGQILFHAVSEIFDLDFVRVFQHFACRIKDAAYFTHQIILKVFASISLKREKINVYFNK